MKLPKTFLLIFPILLALSVSTQAATYFTVGGTTVSTNTEYAIAPAIGTPLITFIETSASESTATLTYYSAGSPVNVTTALAAGSSNILCSHLGLDPGNKVVIHDASAGVFQRGIIGTTNSTGIIVTNDSGTFATSFALVAGDKLYEMSADYSVVFGATTKTLNGSGSPIFVSPNASRPVLIEVTSTGPATNKNLIITGRYEQ